MEVELHGRTQGPELMELVNDIKGLNRAGCLLIIGSGGKVKIYLNDDKIVSIEESEINMPLPRRSELIEDLEDDELPNILLETIERITAWNNLRYQFTTYVNKPLVYIKGNEEEEEYPLEWSNYYKRLDGRDTFKTKMAY